MKIYLDANVIVDFLIARPAFGLEAGQVMTLVETESVEAFAAANSFVIAFFQMRKVGYSAKDAKHNLALLRRSIHCVGFGNTELDKALSTSEPSDLEDAYQVQLALKCGADVFITNDKKLRKNQRIKFQNTGQFLREFNHG